MQSSLSTQEQIQQVELTIEEARKVIAIGDSIERLEQNADFKKVIFDGYFVEEAARVTGLLAEPAQQRPEQQARLFAALRGIAELRQHLLTTKMMVEQFKNDLGDQQALLDELRAEGV